MSLHLSVARLILDHYLFPDDLIKSGLCSLAIGYSAIAIAMAFQKRIGGRIAHIEGPLMRSVAKFGYMYVCVYVSSRARERVT